MSTTNIPAAPGKTAANIVHEAVDERQYVRTRMNARVRLASAGQAPFEVALQDISLGGLGLIHDAPLKVGTLYDASIRLRLNQVDLNIDSKIRIVSQRGNEVGAQFVELDAQKRDILRYLISAYMSGEIADINGLFNVMQRENYIKERKHKYASARTPGARLKALTGTLLYTAAGIAALAFVGYKGYLLFFRIPALQAQVATNAQVISMPDNGYVKYLLPAGATEVQAGQPLASISTQLAADLPEVRELDINPLLADRDGVIAVDARVRVGKVKRLHKGRSHPRFSILPYPQEWERSIDLSDGRQAFVRPVRPEDEDLFRAFFEHVTQDDLRLRFFRAMRHFSHEFIARLTQLDYARSIALLAIDPASGEMLGAVRLHADADYDKGEYGVLVRSDLKGLGIGWKLMSIMIECAQWLGLNQVEGQVLRENGPMLAMCEQLGFKVRSDPDDLTVALVTLDLHQSSIKPA